MKGFLSSRLLKGTVQAKYSPLHKTQVRRLQKRSVKTKHGVVKAAKHSVKAPQRRGGEVEEEEEEEEEDGGQQVQENEEEEEEEEDGGAQVQENEEEDDDDDDDDGGEGKQAEPAEEEAVGPRSDSKAVEALPVIEEASPTGPVIPDEWQEAAQSIAHSSVQFSQAECTSAPVVCICGGKNAGKSTFARYLLNSLLQTYDKVGFLDTDVGQPELTPSGCLSLHILDKPISGLPTLQMRSPERCYFYGDVSPKSDPQLYMHCIFSLYDYFRETYCNDFKSPIPLVINTHGWIQGVGLSVLVDIICYTVPTHVVQILLKASSKNLPPNRFWDHKASNVCNAVLMFLHGALGGNDHLAEIKFNARELRDLRFVSYFQNVLMRKVEGTVKLPHIFSEAAMALACWKPYQVPVLAIHVIHLHHQVPSSESLYCLNAAIVGLGVSSASKVSDKESDKTLIVCIGLGIVRAVDAYKNIFYVLSPLPLQSLQQVDTFVHGRLDIPIPLLKAPGYVSPYLCHNSISIEGTGSAVMGSGKKKFLRP